MDKKVVRNLAELAIGILAIGGVWFAVKCSCLDLKLFTPASFRDFIRGFGDRAAAVYILAYALNTVSIFPPIGVLSLTAGLAFGKVWGAVFLMSGAMLGTSCTFFISRILGRRLVESLLRGKFKKLDDSLGRRGFETMLFFRIVPLVPYEILNYASGLSRIKFRDYFLATFLGLTPGVIISAFFGGALGEIRSMKDFFSFKFGIALASLIMIVLIPVAYRNFKKTPEPK